VTWQQPSARERKAILDRTRSIAIVGVSSKPSRPSYFVATYLLSSSADYDVYFVNPAERELLGRPVYPSLDALPVVPDLVDVFRKPKWPGRPWRSALGFSGSNSDCTTTTPCRSRTMPASTW